MSESTQQHTLERIFECAIQIEEKAGSIYRELEKRFSHHPKSAALWKAMAADEDSHAQMLRQVLERTSQEQLDQPVMIETRASVSNVLELMGQDLLSSVKTLRDAYELAHRLEYSEVNAVLEFLVIGAVSGDVAPEFIRSHITMHQRRLTEFRQNLDSMDWTQVRPQ